MSCYVPLKIPLSPLPCGIGDKILSPGAKNGMIPLAIPLAENSSGTEEAH